MRNYIDNGILAMTISITSLSNYASSRIYFEHIENITHANVSYRVFKLWSTSYSRYVVT